MTPQLPPTVDAALDLEVAKAPPATPEQRARIAVLLGRSEPLARAPAA